MRPSAESGSTIRASPSAVRPCSGRPRSAACRATASARQTAPASPTGSTRANAPSSWRSTTSAAQTAPPISRAASSRTATTISCAESDDERPCPATSSSVSRSARSLSASYRRVARSTAPARRASVSRRARSSGENRRTARFSARLRTPSTSAPASRGTSTLLREAGLRQRRSVGRREVVAQVPLHGLRGQHQTAQVVALVQADDGAHTVPGQCGRRIPAPVRAALQRIRVATEGPEVDGPKVQRLPDVGDHGVQQAVDVARRQGLGGRRVIHRSPLCPCRRAWPHRERRRRAPPGLRGTRSAPGTWRPRCLR